MIRDAADLAMGAAHLARVCPVWARVLPELGPLPLRRWEEGFPSIRDAVVSQQISTQAAGAILARLAAAGLSDEAAIRAADDDALRAAGLSRPKARYLRGIAEARVDWAALKAASVDFTPASAVRMFCSPIFKAASASAWAAMVWASFWRY